MFLKLMKHHDEQQVFMDCNRYLYCKLRMKVINWPVHVILSLGTLYKNCVIQCVYYMNSVGNSGENRWTVAHRITEKPEYEIVVICM
jgi:hypothetical protein